MTTDTRRHTPAQHDDGQACLGCGQDWPCATERERQRIVDDWLASPEAEQRLAEALEAEGFVRSVANRYGRFNAVYWEQSARALTANLREQAGK